MIGLWEYYVMLDQKKLPNFKYIGMTCGLIFCIGSFYWMRKVGPANIAPLAPRDLRFDLTGGRVTLSWNVSAATAPWSSFIVDVGTASSLSNLGSYDTGSPLRQLVAMTDAAGDAIRV